MSKGIDWSKVILDVQIGSTKPKGQGGKSGDIADWILDGGWDEVYERKIRPHIDRIQTIAFWMIGQNPTVEGIFQWSAVPDREFQFRDNLDPRVVRLLNTYQDFTKKLRVRDGKKSITYGGCVPKDVHLMDAAISGSFDNALKKQTEPYAGTTIVIDKWADAQLSDAVVLRRMAVISRSREIGVEGTVRRGSPAAHSKLIKWWLLDRMLTDPLIYYTPEECASLPGMKVEQLRGWDGDKKERAEYVTNLGIHVCSVIEPLL